MIEKLKVEYTFVAVISREERMADEKDDLELSEWIEEDIRESITSDYLDLTDEYQEAVDEGYFYGYYEDYQEKEYEQGIVRAMRKCNWVLQQLHEAPGDIYLYGNCPYDIIISI